MGSMNFLVGQGQDYLKLSQEMLITLKAGETVESEIELLRTASMDDLQTQLNNDSKKYAFWVNIYNIYILHILRGNSALYEDRKKFFNNKQLTIAGQEMSFADVEHGIIRRSQFQYFLGYIRNPFAPKYQKRLRPKKKEYRVHFALNCGAKSCPPVPILYAEGLDEQLNMLTKAYLETVTTFDADKNEVTTTPLASWFRGDFGGKSGTKKILHKLGFIPDQKCGIAYGPYDWSLDLDNFYGS